MQGAAYLYIETLLSFVSGYVFWVLLSRVVTVEVIGVASAVISLSTIIGTIATIGIPNGIQRFLGKSFSEKQLDVTKTYVKTSLLWISIAIASCSIFLLVAHDWISDFFEINLELILVAILIISSSTIAALFRAIVISSLKTKVLPITIAASTSVKLALAVALALGGHGALGVTLAFASFPIVASVILAFVLANRFAPHKEKSKMHFIQSSRDLLTSSTVSWIPAVIFSIGAYLGPVLVFASQGAGEAGVYFMAFAIIIAISAVMQVLFTIAFPALSAMHDGRKRFTWQIIKMSIMIVLPVSSTMIFYSSDVMLLFGEEYVHGASSLSILLASMLPIALSTGVRTLGYAYGSYKQVFIIDLATSLPRAILYIVMLPMFGSVGAAMGYTIGSIIGFVVSMVIARRIGIKLLWKDIALIVVIPSSLALVLQYFAINYIIGIATTLVLSYILFIRFGILNQIELQGILDLLPRQISRLIIAIIDLFARAGQVK